MSDRLFRGLNRPEGHPNRKWADELLRNLEQTFRSIVQADFRHDGMLFTNGGRRTSIKDVTDATYSILKTDEWIDVNRAGAVTLTLPASPRRGQTHVVEDASGAASSNTITVAPPSGVNLNGGSGGQTITTDYGRLTIKYNGSQYIAA